MAEFRVSVPKFVGWRLGAIRRCQLYSWWRVWWISQVSMTEILLVFALFHTMSAVYNLCYRVINHHWRLYLHTLPNESDIVTVFVWQGMNLLRSCENFEFLLRSASTVVQIYQSVQQRLLALKIPPPDSLASTH